jgi:hypothetical protein
MPGDSQQAWPANGEQDDQSVVVRMQYSREHFALTLRRTGFPGAAGEALRVLPDPVDDNQIAAFPPPYGIALGELESRMGGSP